MMSLAPDANFLQISWDFLHEFVKNRVKKVDFCIIFYIMRILSKNTATIYYILHNFLNYTHDHAYARKDRYFLYIYKD